MSRLLAARAAGLLLGLWLAALAPPALAQAPAPGGQRIVLPGEVVPQHYDVTITPDAAALTFTGHVRIDLTVIKATDAIVLNDADIVIDRAALSGEAAAPQVRYDAQAQTATFAFGHALAPGRYSLTLDYHGRIYQQASGLFALDYQAGGATRRALFTQFENSDARRFVPCWDEPARKASFTLTAIAPAGEMAVSNMPVEATTPLAGGLRKVRFQTTPKMSSYLLFFALGDFERIHRDVGGVDVGVIVKRGDTAKAAYALDTAAQILPYYDAYFDRPYALPKLDLIAGPGSSPFFSAMENWGAIFYFERDLLIDPRISTERDRQNVYVTIAHEMAHQWFGDLVTMQWWDDLWLNEGFATWMENKATDHFHPGWKRWLQELGAKEEAMGTDAGAGTHPIITPIDDVLQAGDAFDDITYQKGAAVIRMLEAYVGEDAFRAGVRRYIAAHAYGNTVTDDLWREIDPVSPGRPITQIAHDFTLQAGVPLITEAAATCEAGREHITLSQDRFSTATPPPPAETWRVPLSLAAIGGPPDHVVVAGPAPDPITLPGCQARIVNAGQTGYFRSLYAPDALAALTARFDALSPDDQLGLMNDGLALGYVGDQPMAAFLDMTRKVGPSADPIVWSQLAQDLADLDRLYDGLPGQAKFRDYARGVLRPMLAQIGWYPHIGEGDNVGLMRGRLLAVLARLDDPDVVAEAHAAFEDMRRKPSELGPTTRRTVLNSVAEHADADDWDQLHAMAKAAPSEIERSELYALLGQADDPAIAQKALDLALSGEPAPTTAPLMIEAVAERHPGLALDFAIAHWAQLSPMIDPDSRPGFVADLLYDAHDPALEPALNAYADQNIPAGDRQDVRKAEDRIERAARIRDQRLPDVDRWLSQIG